MISRDVAPSPQSSPSGIARTTAAITQTYSGTPPGRLSGSSSTDGTARSSDGVARSVVSAFDITGSDLRGPDQRRLMHRAALITRQERSSQTRNHGTTPPYGRGSHPAGVGPPPGRTRKGEVDSDSLFRVFRWIPWLISDPSGAAIGCCWTESAVRICADLGCPGNTIIGSSGEGADSNRAPIRLASFLTPEAVPAAACVRHAFRAGGPAAPRVASVSAPA